MVFNTSLRYHGDALFVDDIAVGSIAEATGTPVYIYSLKRILQNLDRQRRAFAGIRARIHYSAKANSNRAIMRTLIEAGAGIDAVSGGEIHRALAAGARGSDIVFAGVGKTRDEIRYALEQGVGWLNVENELELAYIDAAAEALNINAVQVAMRLNPQVAASTHQYMSTGHDGAKFGLTAELIEQVLAETERYPRLDFAGLHMHIGSQLGDAAATLAALDKLLALARRHPCIHTLNIGGGMPVAQRFDETIPPIETFAAKISPLLRDYRVILEPGRSIVADAGILVATVLYVKRQAGTLFYIVDASMAELIRPALYQAHHEILPVLSSGAECSVAQVVGPVCETGDMLASDRDLPPLNVGDRVAIMTTGAYGMAMASNYNSRLRPAEVLVNADGKGWEISRRRETIEDLLRSESL